MNENEPENCGNGRLQHPGRHPPSRALEQAGDAGLGWSQAWDRTGNATAMEGDDWHVKGTGSVVKQTSFEPLHPRFLLVFYFSNFHDCYGDWSSPDSAIAGIL